MFPSKKILSISGPTAMGKTSCAVSLAAVYDGELISVDSRQVYRGMDIGTGKDIPFDAPFVGKKQIGDLCIGYRKKLDIPIWLVDIVSPAYTFHVSDYIQCARWVLDEIWCRGKLPILVGGTGFYFRSLLAPPETIHIPINTPLRKDLYTSSLSSLQDLLRKKDRKRWEHMHLSDRQNPRRLIRGIEVAYHKEAHPTTPERHDTAGWDVCSIGLMTGIAERKRRIDDRVMDRYQSGIQDEIQGLLASGYRWDLPSFSSCGYLVWRPWVEGKASIEEVLSVWKIQEYQYAKRQMTWFQKDASIQWFDVSDSSSGDAIRDTVERWYT